MGDAVGELLGDLQDVEWERAQVAQRGEAGTEVVERQPDPVRAQAVELLAAAGGVLDEHGLGELDHEPVRRQAAGGEDLEDLVGELRIFEL